MTSAEFESRVARLMAQLLAWGEGAERIQQGQDI